MSESEELEEQGSGQSENWLGDLVKKGPRPKRHWLAGLIQAGDSVEPSEPPLPKTEEEFPDGPPAWLSPEEPEPEPEPEQELPEGAPGWLKADAPPPPKENPLEELVESIPDPKERLEYPDPPLKRPEPIKPQPEVIEQPVVIVRVSGAAKKQRMVVYRALSVMVESGVQVFAAFEFLSHQAENAEIRDACQRISQYLASGMSISAAAKIEPILFTDTSARMLEVGLRTGKLVAVLQRLADDEQQHFELRGRIWGKLFYPVCIAALALLSAILLPPLALSGVLKEVVSLTDEPPAITLWLLWFSDTLSSPVVLISVCLSVLTLIYIFSSPVLRRKMRRFEPHLWTLPGLNNLLRTIYSARFLQLFSLCYEVGLPADQSLRLAACSTGSERMAMYGRKMQKDIREGLTLSDTLALAGFLPFVALETVQAGEAVGKVPDMAKKVASILLVELDYRLEAALKVLEPLMLLILGIFVGLFAVGCLLPILKLAETL